MDILTIPVYFGISFVIIIFLFNLFHVTLASIFGVRVEKFGILLTIASKYFLKFKRNYTEYSLGWIPTGGYVKISGMFDDNIDNEPVKAEDYMLSSKSPIIRFICTVGAPLLLLIPFVISAIFINSNTSINENFNVLNDVISNLYQFITGNINSTQANTNWNTIASSNDVFPIILCMVSLFTAFASIYMLSLNLILQKIQIVHSIISIAMLILYVYIFYKVGSLYFSLHAITDAFVFMLKFLATTYLLSFILMLLIKYLPKNKYI